MQDHRRIATERFGTTGCEYSRSQRLSLESYEATPSYVRIALRPENLLHILSCQCVSLRGLPSNVLEALLSLAIGLDSSQQKMLESLLHGYTKFERPNEGIRISVAMLKAGLAIATMSYLLSQLHRDGIGVTF